MESTGRDVAASGRYASQYGVRGKREVVYMDGMSRGGCEQSAVIGEREGGDRCFVSVECLSDLACLSGYNDGLLPPSVYKGTTAIFAEQGNDGVRALVVRRNILEGPGS